MNENNIFTHFFCYTDGSKCGKENIDNIRRTDVPLTMNSKTNVKATNLIVGIMVGMMTSARRSA